MNEHFYAMKHIESIIALIRYTKEVSEEELSNSENESKGRRAYLHGVAMVLINAWRQYGNITT